MQALSFGRSAVAIDQLSDSQFLAAIGWNSTAPSRLVAAARAGRVPDFAREYRRLLKGAAKRWRKQTAAAPRPALWSRDAFPVSDRAAELFEIWELDDSLFRGPMPKSGKKARKRARAEAARCNGSAADRSRDPKKRLDRYLAAVGSDVSPAELLVLFEMLLCAGKGLGHQRFLKLWRTALAAALKMPGERYLSADQELTALGEIPWVSSLVFSPVSGAPRMQEAGRRHLIGQLLDHTDKRGLPDASLVRRLPLWFAGFVRSAHWAAAFKIPLWDPPARKRFRRVANSVAPLVRPDGKAALANGESPNAAPLLAGAAKVAGWKSWTPAAVYASRIGKRGGKKVGKTAAPAFVNRLKPKHRPSAQSDEARFACLRSDWSTQADLIAVAHQDCMPLVDLSGFGHPLVSGVWELDVSVGGERIDFPPDWECCCWYSDDDCDYVELSARLPGAVHVERQILLARQARFALLAEAVSGAGEATIELASRLPLAAGVQGELARQTRECVLSRKGVAARVFPLALPRNRVESAAGSLALGDGMLELKQTARGGLFAPLVFDWAPWRAKEPADWRVLTVTQDAVPLASDAAVGTRVRVGAYQLLIFRSFVKSEIPRAVLGLHTSHETVVGRFNAAGNVEPILIVE